MTRKDLLDTLNNFEQHHCVDQWEMGGVNIWPLIKIDMFFRHIESEANDEALKGVKKKEKSNKIYRILASGLSLFRYLFFLMSAKRHVPVFLSDSQGHRVVHGGKYINRY